MWNKPNTFPKYPSSSLIKLNKKDNKQKESPSFSNLIEEDELNRVGGPSFGVVEIQNGTIYRGWEAGNGIIIEEKLDRFHVVPNGSIPQDIIDSLVAQSKFRAMKYAQGENSRKHHDH